MESVACVIIATFRRRISPVSEDCQRAPDTVALAPRGVSSSSRYRYRAAMRDGEVRGDDHRLRRGGSKLQARATPLLWSCHVLSRSPTDALAVAGVAYRGSITAKPAIVLVGADKAGVGKTTISRSLLDYFSFRQVRARAFDTEVPRGTLKRFHPSVTDVVDITHVPDQMKIFDTVNSAEASVSLIDIRARSEERRVGHE